MFRVPFFQKGGGTFREKKQTTPISISFHLSAAFLLGSNGLCSYF